MKSELQYIPPVNYFRLFSLYILKSMCVYGKSLIYIHIYMCVYIYIHFFFTKLGSIMRTDLHLA